MNRRRRLYRWAMVLALGWLGYGLGVEAYLAVDRQVVNPQRREAPARWRWGTEPAERLRRVVTRIGREIPPGRSVAFSSPLTPGHGAYYRYMWAAYFLAGHDVIPALHPHAYTEADYWLTYATRLEHPRLQPVFEWRAGALYRVLPP